MTTVSRRRPPRSPRPTESLIEKIRKGLQSAQGLVAFIGVVLAAGFSLVYIIVTVSREPVVEQISPPNLRSLEAKGEIVGQNLDLVTGAYLSNPEFPPVQMFYKVENESKIRFVVPTGVPEQVYKVELRWKSNIPLLPIKTMVVSESALEVKALRPTCSEDPSKCFPIVFANLDWNTVRLQNAIAQFIIENGYGYETEKIPDIPGKATEVWQSLLNGTVHVEMEVWLPNLQEEWDPAMAEGSVIPLGKSLDNGWQSGFVVPKYMLVGDPVRGIAPMSPGLKSVEDLHRYVDVFATPQSRGKVRLVNCPESWACSKITPQQAEAYGLEDVVEVWDPPSDKALVASLTTAYEGSEPWLGYMWGPQLLTTELQLTRLEEPPFSPLCWNTDKGCGYDPSRVRIVVSPVLIGAYPDVIEMLQKWDFYEATQIAGERCIVEANGLFDEAAICYLKNQELVWTNWVPKEVADRVKEAYKSR